METDVWRLAAKDTERDSRLLQKRTCMCLQVTTCLTLPEFTSLVNVTQLVVKMNYSQLHTSLFLPVVSGQILDTWRVGHWFTCLVRGTFSIFSQTPSDLMSSAVQGYLLLQLIRDRSLYDPLVFEALVFFSRRCQPRPSSLCPQPAAPSQSLLWQSGGTFCGEAEPHKPSKRFLTN